MNSYEYFNSSNSAHGNLKTQSDPYFSGETALNTQFTYLLNGIIKTIDSPTTDISYSYNGLNFTTSNLSTGQVYAKVLNAIAELESASDAGGNISYSYNSAGKPIQITNGEGPGQSVISITYNTAGFQTGLQDPDVGNYTYIYNPLGELISSIDEKGNCYEMNYDVLGRITEKKLLSPLQLTTYTYDGQNGLGLLSSVTDWDGMSTVLMYDQFAMISQKTEIIQGYSYNFNYEYDVWGNLKKETWPTGYAVNYKYKNGILHKVNENSSSKTLWQLNNVNAHGQIKEYLLGNGLTTSNFFNMYGFPIAITTSNNIQNLYYDFNEATGNLTWRKDLNDFYNSNDDLLEEFVYDVNKLNNRLISWSVVGGQSYSIGYNDNGNINSKSDVGASFLYNVVGSTSGPHAVSSIVQPTEDYLNMATLQEIEYTAFNKVSQILHTEDLIKLKLSYGPDNQRKISGLYNIDESKSDILIKKKFFVSNDYEIEVNGQGEERKLHYLYGGDGLFAIYVMENNTANMYYVHKDYQGSFQTITDGNGVKLEELSFDPWGRRRNPVDWSFNNVPDEFLFDRGYTGHEHLEEFNLINMNGRVYDPFVARFLSPDPFVQSPDHTQSYNRYSYGLNNPLKYTDPSGYNYHPDDWSSGGSGMISYTPYFGPGYQGGIGPLSGNHWSNQSMGEYYNFIFTGSNTFDGLYGAGASEAAYLMYSFPEIRDQWQQGQISVNDVMETGYFWVQDYNSGVTVGQNNFVGFNSTNNELAGTVSSWTKIYVPAGKGGGWASSIDWTGVTNASLNVLGGVGEMIVGGAGEYFSVGTATPVCIPLIVDGGYRTATNFSRLVGYLTFNNRFANAMPGNIGATIGKGIDMLSGVPIDGYGYGQGIGGATNDFVSFIVTGGTAGSMSNMVSNPTLMNGVWYMSAYGGYTNSLFYDLYPLKK